jgi:hypothetical protein
MDVYEVFEKSKNRIVKKDPMIPPIEAARITTRINIVRFIPDPLCILPYPLKFDATVR